MPVVLQMCNVRADMNCANNLLYVTQILIIKYAFKIDINILTYSSKHPIINCKRVDKCVNDLQGSKIPTYYAKLYILLTKHIWKLVLSILQRSKQTENPRWVKFVLIKILLCYKRIPSAEEYWWNFGHLLHPLNFLRCWWHRQYARQAEQPHLLANWSNMS